MSNLSQPPEGILDPQQPYWPADKVAERTWLKLKGKLTGRPIEQLSGEQHTSYVRLTEAEADKLIENIKKYGQYPQVNQNDKYGGALNNEAYQKWLVEEFLEKPFREQVDKKIEERQIESRLKEIQETKKQIKEVETKEEVVAVVEDKIEVLEEIKEQINPPRSEYQIPDPWAGSYTSGKPKTPQATVKKKKKPGRPKGSGKKKKENKVYESNIPQTSKKKMILGMVGTGLQSVGKSLFSGGGGGGGSSGGSGGGGGGGTYTPTAAGEGPSMLQFGLKITGKIKQAFADAKKEKERADKAEENGYELTPEQKEKGYFLKKSIGYHFGGEAYDKTFGSFLQNKSIKTTSNSSKFESQFNYGDKDPKAKQKNRGFVSDLSSGFKQIGQSLEKVNQSLNKQINLTEKLVTETTRSSDILEEINQRLLGIADVEVNTMAAEESNQKSIKNFDADINFDINKGEDSSSILDNILNGIDAIDDIADLLDNKRRKKVTGGERKTTRTSRRNITGDVPSRRRGFGGMPRIGGRRSFASGGITRGQVPALVGEAGPEIVVRNSGVKSPKKMAAGGVVGGGDVSNIVSSRGYGGIKGGEVMGLAQPFMEVMELPIKTSGAIMLGNMGGFLRGLGPLGGVFAPMFQPLLNPFSKSFGIDKNVARSALLGGIPDRKNAISMLGDIFKDLGWSKGNKGDKAKPKPPGPPGSGSDFWTLVAVASMESGDGQGRADVAQSVYNRLTDGAYGSTLTEILTAENQYEPAFNARGVGNGINPLFKQITDVDSAAAAVQDGSQRIFSRNISIEQAKQQVEEAARQIVDPSLQAKAAEFVQGRTEFLADDPTGVERPEGGNSFSWKYGSGKMRNQAAAPVPSFSAASGGNVGKGKFGRLLGSYVVEGPMSGFPFPFASNKNIEMHGKERVKIYEKGIAIRPIETPEYSQSRNPKETAKRNEQLDKEIGLNKAAMGLNILGGVKRFVKGLVKRYNPFQAKGLSRGTRATAGFTGMSKAGYEAISAGAKFIESKKAQLLGRGAYSAPHISTAMRYAKGGRGAGHFGMPGAMQEVGGIIRTIVPGNAIRANFIEPQSKVRGPVFDKGKILADKIMSGAYSNSPLANNLRAQLTRGYVSPDLSIAGSNLKMLKFLGKVVRVTDLPLIGDMLFPESTAQYDQLSGPNAYYNNPKLSPQVKQKMMEQLRITNSPAQSQNQTVNIVTISPPSKPTIIPIASPRPPAPRINSQRSATQAIEMEKLRRHS